MFPFQSQRCERRLYPTHTKKKFCLPKLWLENKALEERTSIGKNIAISSVICHVLPFGNTLTF